MQRMKNPVVIIGILIILSVLGIGTFVFSQKSSELQTENVDTNMENNQTPGTQQKTSASPAMAGSATRYIEYTKSAFDGAANKRRVLFFYANWCPTCRPADASFQQNKNQWYPSARIDTYLYHACFNCYYYYLTCSFKVVHSKI